jgi:hypothetical protein
MGNVDPETLAAANAAIAEIEADELKRIDAILACVKAELLKATRKHGSMESGHEGYAVILEELDELWDLVKSDQGRELAAMEEATQIAAMAVRYIFDLAPAEGP